MPRSPDRLLVAFFLATVAAALCLAQDPRTGGKSMAFTISSTQFQNGGPIPKKFTCDGPDVSPELSWSGASSKAQSFTLIADDPDAPVGTWTHWVIYDIPAQSAVCPRTSARSTNCRTALARAGMTSGASDMAAPVRRRESRTATSSGSTLSTANLA